MYNRYIGNTGRFVKVKDSFDEKPSSFNPSYHEPECSPPPAPTIQNGNKQCSNGIIGNLLSSVLPQGIDTGDLLLAILLLLLYNESGDEQYLIILAAVFFMH